MLLRQLLAAFAKRAAGHHKAPEKPAAAPVGYTGTVAPLHGLSKGPTLAAIYDGDDERAFAEFMAKTPHEQLQAIEAEIGRLDDRQKKDLIGVLRQELDRIFIPNPGPQTRALVSAADLLLYGGAAGGGKSFLEIGCAATEHRRALIVRRQSVELDGLVKDSRALLQQDSNWAFNGSTKEWAHSDGRSIRFGGIKEPDEWRKYAGQARDFMGFDEAGEFLESQVASLLAWLRSTEKGQRCRAILASNPPRGADGQWLINWFAPWLEPAFPEPAAPGDLRWAVFARGETVWIDDPAFEENGRAKPVVLDGEEYTPMSRTFIPARLDDNPYLSGTNYRAQVQSLPEPLRSQLLKGDFLAGRTDDAWQVIPTAWIAEAQARWTAPPPGQIMTSLGVDVAQGGSDQTVLAPRYGTHFAELKAYKGIDTKDGPAVAGLVVTMMRDNCEIVIDLGGGWGGSAFDHLKHQALAVTGVNPSSAATGKSKEGLAFRNMRAQMWWKFREALDPNTGSRVALPHDPALVADLTAPCWKLTPGGILIEGKEDVRERLGRSTDRADAVIMAWAHGTYREQQRKRDTERRSTANLGYAQTKRRLGHR